MKTIRVNFCGKSWGTVEHGRNPFLEYLGNTFNIVLDDSPDYLFVRESADSLEEFVKHRKDQQIRIFYCGEALVPDFNIFDYAIGFDDLKFGDRYIRLHTLVFFDRYLRLGELFRIKDAGELMKEKTHFCDFIYSNSKAHTNRDLFFRLLSQYKRVDSLGPHLNNTGSGIFRQNHDDDWREKKIRTQRKYKFSIAFENGTHRGYTTEKLITPMLAGTIPIYWGNPDVARYFNAESFINCHDYTSFEDVVMIVKKLDEDDSRYCEMLEKQWLSPEQYEEYEKSMTTLAEFLNHIFEQDFAESRRRGQGYWNSIYEETYARRVNNDSEYEQKNLSLLKLALFKAKHCMDGLGRRK